MAEPRPPFGSSSGGDRASADGRLRVLVIQSDIAPLDAVLDAFPAARFDANFAGDALTVLASVSAREVDVVLLDTPLFELEVDTLLWKLEQQQSRVPVLVLGGTPPPQPMRLQFPVRYLPKPIDAERLRREVEAAARAVERPDSAPPVRKAHDPDDTADFLEWSRLTMELTEEAGPADAALAAPRPELGLGTPSVPPLPELTTQATLPSEPPAADAAPEEPTAAAPEEPTAAVPVEEPTVAAPTAVAPIEEPTVTAPVEEPTVAAPTAAAEAAARAEEPVVVAEPDQPTVVAPHPPPVPRRPSTRPRPSTPPARGVDVVQTLTPEGPEAARPLLAGRSAIVVGRRTDVATRVSLALYAAGVEVRVLEGGPADLLSELQGEPPDLVVVEPSGPDDIEPTLRAFRTEVRLWHRPLLAVAADAELESLLQTTLPGGPDAVVRADAGEAELVAKAGFLLAPAEQVRERMLQEKIAAGEIGPVGVATLVRLAAVARPEGRLVLRGDGRLVELDLRGAEIVLARLTEPDGRQLDGAEALAVALTIRAGRYSLRPPPVARPMAATRLPIPQALWEAADRLGALIRRLAPERLPRVRRLRLRDRSGPVRGLTSVELRARERLHTGDSPRLLVGAPGLGPEAVARLVEKLVLCGDVVDVEEDEAGAAPAEVVAEPVLETLDAAAVEELPAVVAPPRPPALRTLLGIGPSVPVRAAPPPPAQPAPPPEAAPLPPVPLAPPPEAAPAGPDPPSFGILPAPELPFAAEGPPGGGWPDLGPPAPPPAPSAAPPRRSAATWVVPIALLGLGLGVLGVLYATGRLGGGRQVAQVARDGEAAEAAAVAAGTGAGLPSGAGPDRGVTAADVPHGAAPSPADVPPLAPEVVAVDSPAADAAVADPAVLDVVEPDVAAPDAGPPPSDGGGPDAGSAPDVAAPSAAGPEATAPPEAAPPPADATTTPPATDSGALLDAGTLRDRPAPAARDGGTTRGGPALLVVPRPEGVSAELVVFVDGVRRGTAPLQLELPAGEHELRFEAGGRQSLSRVRLRAGERKTVVPRQLLRQLQSP